MEQKHNYQLELEKIIKQLQEGQGRAAEAGTVRPTLLLHACCAPCSSYCLEYLRQWFDITVFYFNPNITGEQEYRKRVEEEKRLIKSMNEEAGLTGSVSEIKIMEGRYEPSEFLEIAKGYEECPEGGERCERCFRQRLMESAKAASEGGFDFFTTTLTISPLKNAELLNSIGREAGEKYGIAFLPSDFKKKGGYQRSIELSKEYHLYRQDYCGCGYSKAEAEKRRQDREVQREG